MAAPASRGELQGQLQELAAKKWRHPISGAWVLFGLSTIERWYYKALRSKAGPVEALKRKIRSDHGIGEPFNLSLPSRSAVLCSLPQPLPISFTVLEEKFLGRTVHAGRLAALSESEAGIESALSLAPLSNVKIELQPVAGANPGGEIYAKVIGAVTGASGQTRIRFTSLSPELKVWEQQTAAQREL